MTTEQKALALVNEVQRERHLSLYPDIKREVGAEEALCRAIEAHEADNARNEQRLADQAKAFSDAVALALTVEDRQNNTRAWRWLSPFILPEPDPLVEAMDGLEWHNPEQLAPDLRDALAARGYKIERIDNAE